MKIPSPTKLNDSASMPLGNLASQAKGEVGCSPDLQSRYFDICLIDFEADVFSSVYHNPAKFAPPAPQLTLSEKIREELAGQVHPDDAELFASFLTHQTLQKRLVETPSFTALNIRQKGLDDSYHPVRVIAFPALSQGSGHMFLVCTEDLEQQIPEDLCNESAALQQQKLDALRYKAVVDHTRTLVFEWSGKDLTYLSHRIPELLSGDYDGRNPFDVWREDEVLYVGDMEPFDTCLARLALGIRSGEMTVRLRRRDGQYIWCKITYTKLDDGESVERYIGTLNECGRRHPQ